MDSGNVKRFNALDGLRFIMCAAVVVCHLEFLSDYSYGNFYSKYLQNAMLAVDYFFMLSGFGIFFSFYNKDKNNCGDLKINGIKFAVSKIKKIYPLYIASIIVSLPLSLASLGKDIVTTGNPLFEIVSYIVRCFFSLTLTQSFFGTMYFTHVLNGVAWFLSTLFMIYMLAPIFYRIICKFVKNCISSVVMMILSIWLIFALNFICGKISADVLILGFIKLDTLSYVHPFVRCFYFLLGMLLGKLTVLIKEKKEIKISVIIEVIVCVLGICFHVFIKSINIPMIFTILFELILCCLLIFVFANGDENKGINKILSNPKLVQLGKDSMYLYLIHYPVRMFIGACFKYGHIYFGEITGIVEAVIVIVLSVVASVVVKKILEKRNLKKLSLNK